MISWFVRFAMKTENTGYDQYKCMNYDKEHINPVKHQTITFAMSLSYLWTMKNNAFVYLLELILFLVYSRSKHWISAENFLSLKVYLPSRHQLLPWTKWYIRIKSSKDLNNGISDNSGISSWTEYIHLLGNQ